MRTIASASTTLLLVLLSSCGVGSLNAFMSPQQSTYTPLSYQRNTPLTHLPSPSNDAQPQSSSSTCLPMFLSRPNVPILFHGHYNFGRDNVVELSQLISRHLEDKPCEIDSNKIYDCVRVCFTDLEKGYGDNPDHYDIDMRMLLATCLACNWFTEKQDDNIFEWNEDYFG